MIARLAAASVDDVAAGAGRASMKAAGVIVDDAAVTPRYVQGFKPDRELPVIKKIAIGSLRNKLLFILPAALLLSELLPWLLTPILMIGGTYLCYEGAEKLWEWVNPGPRARGGRPRRPSPARSRRNAWSAARSAPTSSCRPRSWSSRSTRWPTSRCSPARSSSSFVAFAITVGVYGVVGLIVKMDDIGLKLVESGKSEALGRGLVRAMPVVLNVLSKVGIIAMLWVGGHILLVGLDELGVHFLYDFVHHLEEDVHEATGALGGVLGWLTNTIASAILGTVVGAIVVTVLHLRKGKSAH